MQQVADHLGVSRTTVSLVLKGEGDRYRIAPSTQKRIRDYVQRTGFKPNFFASNLTRRRTGNIGLVFPDLFEDFMGQGLRGIEDVLLQTDLMPIICSSRFDAARETQQIEELLHRGVDGLIVAPTAVFRGQRRSLDVLKRVHAQGVPLVFLDRRPASMKAGIWVRQDDRAGGELAANWLTQRGCRRPAYVGFDLDIVTLQGRLAGYKAGLQAQGLSLHQNNVLLLKQSNPRARDLEPVLARWMRRRSRPDGLFVPTAGLAERCGRILKTQGLLAGRDVPLIRFGPSLINGRERLQGIVQPHYAMGHTAARLLRDWIQTGDPPEAKATLLPVALDTTKP